MGPDEKRAVLVLGMHRSGTSAVAGAVHLLGAEPPKYLIPTATDNPSGFFEAALVLGVNDWILKAGDSTWFDCLNFDPDSLSRRSRVTGLALVNFSLIEEFKNASLLLLKDPRLCLLLDYWLPVLRATSITPAALLVLRDPNEVIASLVQRDRFPGALTAALWLRYMLAAEHTTRDCPRSFIRYDALLGDWRTCMARAAAQAGVRWPAAFDAVDTKMQRFLDVGLRHHHSAAPPAAPPGSLAALMGEAYRALLAIAEDDGDAPRHRLDELRATFTVWCRRDGASFTARALEGHVLLQQPAHPIPPRWEERAGALALRAGGQADPV
jgi:hypothetical protein